jgi:hypothetical protein
MAVTIQRRRDSVFGNQRVVFLSLTTNGIGPDTLNVNNAMHVINGYSVVSGGANAIGATDALGIITFGGVPGPARVTIWGT